MREVSRCLSLFRMVATESRVGDLVWVSTYRRAKSELMSITVYPKHILRQIQCASFHVSLQKLTQANDYTSFKLPFAPLVPFISVIMYQAYIPA